MKTTEYQEDVWFEVARLWGRSHGDEFMAIQMFRAMIPPNGPILPTGAYQGAIISIRQELESRYGPAKE